MRATVTACIIARDEEDALPACLESVAFCDEVVVVDSGSRDATVALAGRAGARVVEQPWLGFGAQRNVAIDHARGDWVLEIDADERVSPELRAEIEAFLAAPPHGVELAGLPLRERFLGRPLGPSAKYPKYRHRLFRRGAYRHDPRRTVHEGLVPHGRVHAFSGDLVHELAGDWREALGDTWRYARLEAGQLEAPRTPHGVVAGAALRPAAKAAFRLLVDGGWRDGWRGLARIALDCAGDALVWLRHAAGRRGDVRGRSGVASGLHFGAWRTRRGPARIVAVAGSADGELARAWVARARALGIDAEHVAPSATALSAAEQLRPIDATVAFGRRARLVLAMPGVAPRVLRLDGTTTNPGTARARALETREAEPDGAAVAVPPDSTR